MIYTLLLLTLPLLVWGPQWWVRQQMRRHSAPRPDLPGSGGELARHLLDQHQLHTVGIEACPSGQDHYDPAARCVRLSPEHLDGKSLSAVAIAAHEVGHALQHAEGDSGLRLRQRLIGMANGAARLGALLLLLAPLLTLITRIPGVGLLIAIIAFANIALPPLVHLVTLPVEWDASFGRALPLLQRGRYLNPTDLGRVRALLRAAALTYVAAALAGVLHPARWWWLLRRG